MPLIKSAKKRMKQNEVRRTRLLPVKTYMKTMIRKIADATKAGKKADAEKLLPEAYKAIDTAAKKNVLHSKTADRKKAACAKMVASCK